MAYFVNVGPFTSNEGRLGARGYHIMRRGNVVKVTWGGITVRRSRYVQYVWRDCTSCKEHVCSSEQAAMAKREELIRQRESKEGYKRLGVEQRILKTSRSHPCTPKP